MAVLNSTILEHAWLEGSNDFQQRIPNPAIAGYASAVENLFAIQNNDMLNEFTGLLNGIIGTYVEQKRFENPLRVLFKPAARFGNTERRIAVHYLAAHCDLPSDETLLKTELPEFESWYYSVGKPRRYEFSWPRVELERAFAADGYGYEDLLAATISQAYSSDAYDEMNIMIQMFAEADQRMGGLYRYNLSAAPTTEAAGKELLTGIRAVAGRMAFPTMLYNHIPVPVHESGDTLILWLTPEVRANLDVNTLSSVFNLDKADIQYRIVTIPEFPIPNIYAALTSEDFIYARDIQYGMEPPFYNPGNLTFKYYLHHRELIGINPAANCVLFTTDAATVVNTVTQSITGMTFDEDELTAPIGGMVKLSVSLTGTIGGADGVGKLAVEPDAALFSVAASRTETAENEETIVTPVPLNSRTYVDSYGMLHIQKSGLEAGDEIAVTAKSVYVNPSGATTVYTANATVTLTTAEQQGAKECSVAEKPFITYTDDPDTASASE